MSQEISTDQENDKVEGMEPLLSTTTEQQKLGHIALWLSGFSILISFLLGLKNELLPFVVTPQITIDLQESPIAFTKFGYLKLGIFTTIRTNSGYEVDIEGAEIELRNVDDSSVINMKAETHQITSPNGVFFLPFKGLIARNDRPLAEYVTFAEPVSIAELTKIASLEHKLNRALYEQQYPDLVEKKTKEGFPIYDEGELIIPGKDAKKSSTLRGGWFYDYNYKTPANMWTVEAALIKEANKLFEANFKIRPGTYTAIAKVFGKNGNTLATRRYTLTILEGQFESIRESWSRTVGKRYAREAPPIAEQTLRLWPLD